MIRSYFLSFILLCVVLGTYTAVVLNAKAHSRTPASTKKIMNPAPNEATAQEKAVQDSAAVN